MLVCNPSVPHESFSEQRRNIIYRILERVDNQYDLLDLTKMSILMQITLLTFGTNLYHLSAQKNLNVSLLSQISELISSAFFLVLSDLTKMSISMQISLLTFGTNLSDLSELLTLFVQGGGGSYMTPPQCFLVV